MDRGASKEERQYKTKEDEREKRREKREDERENEREDQEIKRLR